MSGGEEDELVARAKSRVGALLCDKYRIERVLGVGGMASVYAATHRNGHRVALKMLHPELSIRADVRQRFRREGHASNSVNHPGAVIVTDDDVAEDGSAFLVMELLDGQSVEEVWEQSGHRLPPKTVLAIGWELCDVLASAHRAGIVHRDLKPANLFVTRDGRLKVLDFGIARMRDATTTSRTQTGMVFGTPAFMAPEQALGKTTELDGQTDIWAVGATMFSLLSGSVVHQGESSQHLAVLAATQPPRSLATVLPDAEPRLVELVDRALAFEKADRWPTAEAMRDAVATVSQELFGSPRLALTTMSDTLLAHAPQPPLKKGGTLESPKGDLRLRPIVGATTGQPVSSSDTTLPLRPRKPKRLWFGATTIALVFLLLSVGVILRGTGGASAVQEPTTDSSDSTTLGHLGPPPSAAQLSAEPISTASVVPSASALPDVSALPTREPSPQKPRPVSRPQVRPTHPVGATSSRKPDCTEPFIMTPEGKKLWKQECL